MLREYEKSGFAPREGSVIFDCGAADGDTAIFFATLYPRSEIHAFECDAANFGFLEKNIALNGFNNVRAHQAALYKRSATVYFDKNYRLTEDESRAHSDAIAAVGIDDFVKTHGITNVGLLKFDIEGGEQDALLGAVETIRRDRPILMVPIYHLKDDIAAIPRFIANLGLPAKIELKWTEQRLWGMDCVAFVRLG